MPTLTIDVTSSVATRVQTAYGASSLADLKARIITDIKAKVVAYETEQARLANLPPVNTAENNLQTAIRTARTTADNEIQLT